MTIGHTQKKVYDMIVSLLYGTITLEQCWKCVIPMTLDKMSIRMCSYEK